MPKFGPEWHALKGLIQLSAAALKRRQAHDRAAHTLHWNALRHLEAAATHPRTRGAPCLGFDLTRIALLAAETWPSTPAFSLHFEG